MEYQRASAATAFSKKLSNGHSFNGKNMYDGVFGGQSKVGSRVEDYAEIFGGGSGSSIPVLDVPELNERKFSLDVSSSKPDYSNIFGGFGDFDFAVSHEEFLTKRTRDKKTPAKTPSYSEGSFLNPSSIPVGNQVLSNDQTSHGSSNGVKQFKMSYSKSSPGNKNGTNGTIHVAVPGYTCLIDEKITPSRENLVSSVVNEPYEANKFGEGIMDGVQCKKPVLNIPPSGVSKQTSKGVDELHSKSKSNGSDFNDVLFGSYDFGQRTPPSKVRRASSMSYNVGGNNRDSLKSGVSRSQSLDADASVSSPPYFDDEVDANSVAATSAAAVKKAIEEAQARLKVAKEIMERRKGHIGRVKVKPSFNGSLTAEERTKGKDTVKQNNFRQDEARETCGKIVASLQTSAGVIKQNAMKVCQVAAESEDWERGFIARKAAGETCAKNFISSEADYRQEEVEKTEAAKEGEREKDVMQALNEYEVEEKKTIERPEKYGENSEVVEEATEQGCERKLDASKESCDKEECLQKSMPGVEFHDQKEDETKLRFGEQWEETKEKVCNKPEAYESKLKDPEKPTEDEKKAEMQELKDTDNVERLTVTQEWVDIEDKHKHMIEQEENDSALNDFIEEENEMLLQDVSIQKEFEKITEEAFEISEQEEEHKVACGPEEKNEEEDACNREDSEQMSDKMEKPEIIDLRHNAFDYEEERGRRLEENGDSLGDEEFMEAEESGDLLEDVYQMEAADEGQKEASESVGTGPEEKNEEEEEEDACNREDNEQMSDKKEKPEIIDLRHNAFDYEEERGRRLEENGDSLGDEEFMEAEESGDLLEDVYQMEAADEGQKEASESVGTGPEEKNEEEEEEDACNREDNEQMADKKEKPKIIDLRHNAFDYEEERGRRLEENGDSLGDEEFMEAEESGDLLEDVYQMEAADEVQKEASQSVGTGPEEKNEEEEEEDACNREDNEQISDKKEKPKIIDLRHNAFDYEEERGRRLEENGDSLGDEEFMEAEESGDLLEDVYQMEAADEPKADEMTDAREDALDCYWEDLEVANDACNDIEFNNLGETLESSINEDSSEMTPELLINEENGGIAGGSKASSECKETRRDSEADEVANDLDESLAFDMFGLAESNLKLNEIKQQAENTTDASNSGTSSIDIDTADMTFEKNQYEQHSEKSENICTVEKRVEELACESEDVREAKFCLKQEKNNNFERSDEGRSVDSQLHCKCGEKHESTQIAHEIEAGRSTEYKAENRHEILMKEERETKNASQEEVKLVKDEQRRVDEEKEREREREMEREREREREREKERIAVERAIREARERAFAEARERAAAGRTNVEAQRKVKAETQGESAKPSAEASDKTFMEAKLKAERAAVERATAEARQRALEKALSEKNSFGARNQAEKFSDAKQSYQSYDSRYKGSCPSATCKYPNSSNQSASKSSEGLDGVAGESAQRCKARVERHERTAERAAKALAEKNERDLLAQKEQAERNRLAETLDAEVKRWSSGKQGNLRALLSTLQYILGPDSGWQPIPLTDIIATAAVKKAYRKATLCVHPDKLQQRGATIQQKYTCEKVFDLLKEAWNRFSAEER